MKNKLRISSACLLAALGWSLTNAVGAPIPSPGSRLGALPANIEIAPADCSTSKVGTSIPASQIGEPVRSVGIDIAVRVPASGAVPAYCLVSGTMAPVDTSPRYK